MTNLSKNTPYAILASISSLKALTNKRLCSRIPYFNEIWIWNTYFIPKHQNNKN